MPNFKIFQDRPEQAKVQIHGSQNLPVLQESDGALVVKSTLATTDVSVAAAGVTTSEPGTTYQVIGFKEWTFGVTNDTADPNSATVKLQVSPDGTAWIDQSATVTLAEGEATGLVSDIFLKYARVYYSAVNGASPVDLTFYFQGQA